jgi:hypothetical protein
MHEIVLILNERNEGSNAMSAQLGEAVALVEADEDRAMFERACKRYLQMTAEEFLGKWNSGYFDMHPEKAHQAADVALLLPLVSAW